MHVNIIYFIIFLFLLWMEFSVPLYTSVKKCPFQNKIGVSKGFCFLPDGKYFNNNYYFLLFLFYFFLASAASREQWSCLFTPIPPRSTSPVASPIYSCLLQWSNSTYSTQNYARSLRQSLATALSVKRSNKTLIVYFPLFMA